MKGNVSVFAVAMVMASCFQLLAGAGTDPQAALSDPLEWLYVDSRTEDVRPYGETDVPENGVAEANVLLNGLKPGEPVVLSSSADAGEWFRLLAVYVTTNTGVKGGVQRKAGDNPFVTRQAPFRVFDAMEPLAQPSFVPEGETAAVRFRLREFPKGAGTLNVRLGVRQGAFSAERTLTVNVHAVRVPPVGRGSYKYTNWMDYQSMALCHGLVPWSEQHWQMIERYLRLAAYGRQNMALIPWRERSKGQVDEATMVRFVELMDKVGLHWIEGPHLSTFINGNWPDKAFRPYGEARGVTNRTTSAAGAKTLARTASAFAALIAKHGWADRWYQHVADEPSTNNVAEYRLTCGIVRKYMPGIRLFDAVETPDMAGAIDAYCPKNKAYEESRADYEALRTRSTDEIWCYTCCFPGGKWMNRLLDNELIRPVLLPWGCKRFGLDGYLHWGFNQFRPANDPLRTSGTFHDAHIATDLPPGDRNIAYAGKDGPWPSVRLEAMRQGFEDLELLRLLAGKDAARADALVGRLARGFGDYSSDVSDYRAVRRDLLNACAQRPRTFCNPMSIPDTPIGIECRNHANGTPVPAEPAWRKMCWGDTEVTRQFRELADPTIRVEGNRWYLYPSCGLMWTSEDSGGTWRHVSVEKESDYAPDVIKFRGKYYLMHSHGALQVSDSPTGPFEVVGELDFSTFGDDPQMPRSPGDPSFYTENDHLYLYWGCCNGPKFIWGVELDPDNPLKARSPARCFVQEDVRFPWLQRATEGAWVFKRGDTYYLTYSVAGGSHSYLWAAMKGPTPMGPFVHQENTPFFYTDRGLVTGTAHGSIFEDATGDWWISYCIFVRKYHDFERFIGMDRLRFDANGDISVQHATETPQWLPSSGRRGDTGWKALPAKCAQRECADGDIKTFCVFEGEAPAVEYDFGGACDLRAFRIIWRDYGLDARRGVLPGPFRYRIDRRENGTWSTWVDASANDVDLLVDYREGSEVRADAVRLTMLGAPKGITPAVTEFTVFGISPGE